MQFESEADAQLCECSLPRARSSSVSSRDNYGMGRVRFDNYGKVCSAIDISNRDWIHASDVCYEFFENVCGPVALFSFR